MCNSDYRASFVENQAKHIKKAWQYSVAEVQRAQMNHREIIQGKVKNADLKYGHKLIKQLGYRTVKDKTHTSEPEGTLYDSMFTTRVHASIANAKRCDGTQAHIATQRDKEAKQSELARFNCNHALGGTLLEQKTNRREDQAWTKKVNTQAAVAIELKKQMEYKQGLFAIDKEMNKHIQDSHEKEAVTYFRQERQIVQDQRVHEKQIEVLVKAQVPQQKATRLAEHIV